MLVEERLCRQFRADVDQYYQMPLDFYKFFDTTSPRYFRTLDQGKGTLFSELFILIKFYACRREILPPISSRRRSVLSDTLGFLQFF